MTEPQQNQALEMLQNFYQDFRKINYCKLLGMTISAQIANFAEYKFNLSLNNFAMIIQGKDEEVDFDEMTPVEIIEYKKKIFKKYGHYLINDQLNL